MPYSPRRGLSIPAVTALDARNHVIEEEQRRIFRYLAQSGLGADIIFACGTTGEWNRITNAQRQKLIQIEADEVAHINARAASPSQRAISTLPGATKPVRADATETSVQSPIEAWAGLTGETVAETLANLECAIESGMDGAVIAPLSIADAGDVVSLFQGHVSDLFDHLGRSLPILLYDNADIAIDRRAPHLRTRDVKRLSRLEFICGVKVSASRRVLGNYTKGAMHFKDKGEFGIYIGNAMLMFEAFRLQDGLAGRIHEYWNRYLLHNELPIGVVAGPANILPREWQRAWRACFAADERLMKIYKEAFERFDGSCRFPSGGSKIDKTIACVKRALKLEQVIESERVADGTQPLTTDEAHTFESHYQVVKESLRNGTDPIWLSRTSNL